MPGYDEHALACCFGCCASFPACSAGPRSLTTSRLADMGTTKPGEQMQPGKLYKSDLIPCKVICSSWASDAGVMGRVCTGDPCQGRLSQDDDQ